MTEITDINHQLPGAIERFILHWGDLGGQWGVNRSVAQIHALLYLSDRPLTAEDIAETLSLARSNVSNSIKELLGWKLIRRGSLRGDRRDYFEAETDVWTMVGRIAQGRKEREIDPATQALRACIAEAIDDGRISPAATKRLKDMRDFVDTISRWYDQMLGVPKAKLIALIRLGSKVTRLLAAGSREGRSGTDVV